MTSEESDMVEKLIDKCREEIKWAEDCIKDMNEHGGYVADDKVWLPCWLKAHKQMLKLIPNQFSKHPTQCPSCYHEPMTEWLECSKCSHRERR